MSEPTIFKELKKDHDRHRALLEKIGETQGDSEERRELFDKLCTELQAHAAAEEEPLYATMLGDPDLRDEARHSVAEHKEIDDHLAELAEKDMSSSGWLTKFKEMRHRYLHHIEEEEEDMFPAADEGLNERTEEEIAEVFEEAKPRELEAAAEKGPGDDRE